MRTRATLFAILVVFAIGCPRSAHADETRTHTVKQILVDGQAAESSADVTVTVRGGKPEHSLHRGEAVDDGTRLDVPAHLVVVIVSTGDKSTVTMEPGSSLVFVSTGKGEVLRSEGGKTLFEVAHGALDFFRVQYGNQVTAGVRGTDFSIEAEGETVTFVCTKDEVAITKTGYITVNDNAQPISLTDEISADGNSRATYTLSQTWQLAPAFESLAVAEKYFQARVAEARRTGSREAVAGALTNLGNVQFSQSVYQDARVVYEQALAIYRETGDRDGEAIAISNVGVVEHSVGQYDDAFKSFGQALELYRAAGDRRGEASMLAGIGELEYEERANDSGTAKLNEALTLYKALGDRRGEASIALHYGLTDIIWYRWSGDQKSAEDALKWYGQALEAYQAVGDRDGEARANAGLGDFTTALRFFDLAGPYYEKALGFFKSVGERDSAAQVSVRIGLFLAVQGKFDAALRSEDEALATFRSTGNRNLEAYALSSIAQVRYLQGKYSEAIDSYEAALSIYRDLGPAHLEDVTQTLIHIDVMRSALKDGMAPPTPAPPAPTAPPTPR